MGQTYLRFVRDFSKVRIYQEAAKVKLSLIIFRDRREIVRLRDSRLPQRGKDNGVKTPPPADDG